MCFQVKIAFRGHFCISKKNLSVIEIQVINLSQIYRITIRVAIYSRIKSDDNSPQNLLSSNCYQKYKKLVVSGILPCLDLIIYLDENFNYLLRIRFCFH